MEGNESREWNCGIVELDVINDIVESNIINDMYELASTEIGVFNDIVI